MGGENPKMKTKTNRPNVFKFINDNYSLFSITVSQKTFPKVKIESFRYKYSLLIWITKNLPHPLPNKTPNQEAFFYKYALCKPFDY
jgi:hypothetical protein